MFVPRPATWQDLPALLELERQSFPGDPWGEVAVSTALRESGYLTLVIEAPGADSAALAGYLIGWHVLDEADLARVGVATAYRRRGLGGRLVAAALEKWSRVQVARVFLDVRAGNVAALKLYDSLGFERVGSRKNYYADGEDAVLMAHGTSSGAGE